MIRTRSIDNYLILSAFSADFIAGFFQNSAAHAYMINSANRMPSKIRFRNRATFHDMENRLIAVRLSVQQLSDPRFDDPRALVRWMGAVQAQDYKAVRWAVGIRLRTASLRAVNRALERGEILRTHVMRPTWHLVAAEDIRWMLRLSARRIRSANSSLARSRGLGIDDGMYSRSNRLIEKMLRGNLCLTKRQIADRFQAAGIAADTHFMTRYLMQAEADGIVCSGPDRAGQFTYALLEERVAPVPELTRDESLGRLARAYFRSHGVRFRLLAGLVRIGRWRGDRIDSGRVGNAAARGSGAVDTSLLDGFSRSGPGVAPAASLRRVPDRLPRPRTGTSGRARSGGA